MHLLTSLRRLVLVGACALGLTALAFPGATAGATGIGGTSSISVQIGNDFVVLIPSGPCTSADKAAFGCVDVVPGALQVFGFAAVHQVSGLPISVVIGATVVTVFPLQPCSIGARAFAECVDVVPGVLQTQELPDVALGGL